MWNIEKITKVAEEKAAIVGLKLSIPVALNPRLTTTLGRVRGYYEPLTGVATPIKMEFSKKFIATASDDEIEQAIAHETAHYIATVTTGEFHGHDELFKSICKKIGCTCDSAKKEIGKETISKRYKYTVFCPDCDFITGYARMCKILKNLNYCKCPKCGSAKLYYKQNW